MVVIVKDGDLTEYSKLETYKYVGLYKVINRITKLIEKLEIQNRITNDVAEENIISNSVKNLNIVLDTINQIIKENC